MGGWEGLLRAAGENFCILGCLQLKIFIYKLKIYITTIPKCHLTHLGSEKVSLKVPFLDDPR